MNRKEFINSKEFYQYFTVDFLLEALKILSSEGYGDCLLLDDDNYCINLTKCNVARVHDGMWNVSDIMISYFEKGETNDKTR